MRSWVRPIVAATLLALWQVNSIAQSPTFRAATELVNLNVTVTGPDEQHVPRLTAEHFQVFEDGVRQTLKFFSPGEMPLDVVILIDTSASMVESMPLVQQAAMRFARALRAGDRATVMGISSGLRVLQPLTADMSAVVQAIGQTRAAGRTPLYAAIYTALRELDKLHTDNETEPRRQAVVVLSDGHDTASAFGFEELMSIVRRHAVPIYTIAPRPSKAIRAQREVNFGESNHEQDFELRTLAAETGARAYFPVALHELARVYDHIATELAHQYALGYQSTNPTRDGAFRRIALRVMRPGVQWRTRAGYLAERGPAAADDESR